MRSNLLAVIAVSFASTVAMADVRHPTMPEALRGSWASNPDDCKRTDKIIVVAARSYARARTDCTVSWVNETAGARGPIYSARLACPRIAGQRKRPSDVILVPKDTDQVSIGPRFSKLADYRRCRSSGAAAR